MTDIGNREILAKNLSYYVEKSGKSQKELAELVGVAASTFNDWIKGKKYPRIDKIEILANYFGILKSNLIEDSRWENPENIENMKIGLFGKEGAAEVNELATILKRINKDEGFRNLLININKLNPDELENITVFVNALVQKKGL